MRRLQRHFVKAILISSVVGCGFSPGAPGQSISGSAASSGNGTGIGTGSGGVTGNGTGIGLTSGGGGDVGTGTGGMTCGQSSVPVMPEPPDILIIQDKSGSMDEDDTGTSCNNGCGAN